VAAAVPSFSELKMFWTPKHHRCGDVTIARKGDEYHLFTEQTPLDPDGPFAGVRSVGHAVSKDLFQWEELPPAISCGPEGSFDGFTIYHMDAYFHEGTWYMHYTGLDRQGPGQQQTVGLATSRDGVHWEKHPDNPVLTADPQWYEPAIPREACYQDKDFGRLWFRDPCVIHDAATGKFGMIVIARDVREHPDVRACLAWATSDDLVRWTPHAPIYSPGRFHTIETPSMFERDGLHYIVFMSHPNWGAPVLTTDPHQDAGDFYAISRNGWEGPYEQPEDEVLLAAHRQLRVGASRTVDGPGGERYFYGWLHLGAAGDDVQPELKQGKVMPPPRRVRFLDDGQMQVVYHEGVEAYCRETDIRPETSPAGASSEPDLWQWGDVATGKRFHGRTAALLPGQYGNAVFSAKVRFLRGERAGLVLRTDDGAQGGWYVAADRRFGRIEFGTLDGNGFIDARLWQPKDEVELKVVTWGPSVEVYADHRLMIHNVRHRETCGRLGYFVDMAEACFSKPRVLAFA